LLGVIGRTFDNEHVKACFSNVGGGLEFGLESPRNIVFVDGALHVK